MWAQLFSYSKISKIIKKDRKLRSRLIADIPKMLFSILGLSQNHIFSFPQAPPQPQQNGGTPRKVPKIGKVNNAHECHDVIFGCHLLDVIWISSLMLFCQCDFSFGQCPSMQNNNLILVQIMLLICFLPLATLAFRSSPRKLHVTLTSNFTLHQKVALLQHFLKGLECWHPTMPSVIFYPLSVARRCPLICDSNYWFSFNSR